MIGRTSVAALLSVVLAGCGGTQIRGMVREEGTGQPLPGAIVRVGDESTRTDPGGFYSVDVDIDDDEPARFMVDANGYEPKSMLVTIDDDQETVYSDVELKKKVSEQDLRREQQELRRDQQELQRQQQQDLYRHRQQQQELQQQQQQQQELQHEQQQQQQEADLERQRAQQEIERIEETVEQAEETVEQAEEQLEEGFESQPEPGTPERGIEPFDQGE